VVGYTELFGILTLRVIWKVGQETFLSENHIFRRWPHSRHFSDEGKVLMKPYRLMAQRILAGIALYVALGAGSSLAKQTASVPEVGELLPADGTAIDVMELKAPPRLEALNKKLQQAVAKDPDWWLAHVQKAKPGEPLPYDARLGLTKEEHGEYLSLTKKITLTKVKAAKVRVQRDGQRIVLSFGDDLPGLKEMVLDLKADTVTTPFGVATERSRIRASEGQRATGPWDGIQWKLEKVEEEPASATSVKFALGKLKESGRGILYFDVKQISEKSRTVLYYLLQYDLKPSR
jgi:hypothetical protein